MAIISPDKERMIIETVHSVLDEFSAGPRPFKRLNLEAAQRMASAAHQEAGRMRIAAVISVVDESGTPILLHRMDGSLLVGVKLAEDKAYSATALQRPTHELAEECRAGKPLFGLQFQDRITLVGGGFPCRMSGQLVGAIGVSGGTVEQDMRIASFALESL